MLEIPPADEWRRSTGSVDDAWQTALEDVGPAGVDKGKGGKYLILPPGYQGEVPDGYIALPSSNYADYALLRSNLKQRQRGGRAAAVAYGKRVKLYPLSPGGRSARDDVRRRGSTWSSMPPSPTTCSFFEALDRFVQAEPWLARGQGDDRSAQVARDRERASRFKPDAAQRRRHSTTPSHEAHAWLDTQYEAAYSPPFYDGAHWALPIVEGTRRGDADVVRRPGRVPPRRREPSPTTSPSSARSTTALGSSTCSTIKDSQGEAFEGANGYRLTVPANAPVNLYWSVTIYDRVTHTLIRDLPWSSRSSHTPGLQVNADGSVDIYFGPQAPQDRKENWIPSNPGGAFEVLFRFYGPRSQSSTRAGSCRTSREPPDRGKPLLPPVTPPM